MFRLLTKLFKRRQKFTGDDWRKNPDISMRQEQARQEKLASSLEENLQKVQRHAGPSYDIVVRRFKAGGKVPAALMRLDGLTDSKTVEEILRTLMVDSRLLKEPARAGQIAAKAVEELVTAPAVREVTDLAELFMGLSTGEAALFFEGTPAAIMCEAKGFAVRDITEPGAELTIRGPREGFVESLRTNTSLVRRRIRIPQLWIEKVTLGDLSRTEVAFAYIKGLASEKVLREVRGRLERIEIDSVLESGYLEEFINDTPWTFFPLVMRTERPDVVAGNILEGRVAIFTDGTPHALVVPGTVTLFVQAPDDYYERFPAGTFIRLLRFAAQLLAILLPGFYVAVINFHQELLPTDLLLRITAAREGVPFPVIVEMLLMELLFEILREAGIRLPTAIGPAISIVGALILGDAAIRAGLVSPAVVVIVALTAIANFATPVFSLAITLRLIRFLFTIAGAVMGLFGIQFVLLVIVINLCALRTFGIPYLAPVAPMIWGDMRDNLLRVWWWGMSTRPKLEGQREPRKVQPGQVPTPGYDPGEGEADS